MGVGNYLMGDEGVGVHVAQRLSELKLPPGVDVLDGGTGGFYLMGALEQYPVVILVDATLDGQPAGTIRLIEPRFAADFPRSLSTHDVGLRDVIEALYIMGNVPKLYLIAVSVEDLQPMEITMSHAVQEAAKQVVAEITTMLWDWWRERNRLSPEEDDNLHLSYP